MKADWEWNLPAIRRNSDHDWRDGHGRRYVSGKGGGSIEFHPDGQVKVFWIETAAIASAHSAGRRKNRITSDAGSDMPPAYSLLFERVASVRRTHLGGFDFPESADLKTLEIFQDIAWRMLRAVAYADADALRDIADAVEIDQGLRSGDLETPTKDWQDIASAIGSAAKAANGIPTRAEVVKSYNAIVPINRGRDIRDALVRMGFGWLPAPSGKPRKR